MTQSEVIKHFAEKTGLKRTQVKLLFATLADLGSTSIKTHGEFPLPGFGKLVLNQRKARMGRNPLTGDAIEIPSKTVLKFRVGKDLKANVFSNITRPDYRTGRPTNEPVTPPDY